MCIDLMTKINVGRKNLFYTEPCQGMVITKYPNIGWGATNKTFVQISCAILYNSS